MKTGEIFITIKTNDLVKICYVGENEVVTRPKIDGENSHNHKCYNTNEFKKIHKPCLGGAPMKKRGRAKK